MSRTEDFRRIKKATNQGALAFQYGEPLTANPWKATETRAAWEQGWKWAQGNGVEVYFNPDAQPWGHLNG